MKLSCTDIKKLIITSTVWTVSFNHFACMNTIVACSGYKYGFTGIDNIFMGFA